VALLTAISTLLAEKTASARLVADILRSNQGPLVEVGARQFSRGRCSPQPRSVGVIAGFKLA